MNRSGLRRVASYLGLGGIALCLLPLSMGAAQSSASQQRPFEVNDLFELESVGQYFGGPYAFSSDGQKLAFTRVRAKKTLANFKWEYLWGNAGGDVWVQLKPTDPPMNVTNGIEDGSGWWSPQWSPDGKRLAMLSTRGGNARLWVWDVATRTLKRLTDRGVDLNGDVHERPYMWVDDTHILCPVLPEGDQPLGMKIELQTPAIASAEWPKTAKGKEAAVSVLESGIEDPLDKRPQGELLMLNTLNVDQRVILNGNTRSLQMSPARNAVAFTKQVSIYRPKADESLGFDSSVYSGLFTVGLIRLDGTAVSLTGEMSQNVLEDSLRWSPDGQQLAYLGYQGSRDGSPLIYNVDQRSGKVEQIPLKGIDATPVIRTSSQFEWTAAGDYLVLAAKRPGPQKPDVMARRDWWLISPGGNVQLLTESMKNPPRELWPETGRKAFVGLADGMIWRIEPSTGRVADLTQSFGTKIESVVWPAMTNIGTDEYRIPGATYSKVIFSAKEKDSDHLATYLLDLQSEKITPIQQPTPEASLVAYSSPADAAIFYSTDRNGLHVWRRDLQSNKFSVLFAANEFLRNVAEGEFKPLDYTSLNGEKLKGWILLPYGYKEGKRYPLLTWVYAGSVYHDRPPSYWSINSNISLNLQIPAARGYAVLFPSMPLAKEGLTEDPMLRLPEGVLPAVDKVIQMGIADPNRLYLMGQSFGGFSTYGLVTQTQRFNAAVSLAGLSDLISLYGQFGARERYTQYPQEDLFMQALMESAQVGMGNPPWKDLGRYLRNSPIFYVDRVQTPIMIIQGDIDYVAIQQGEEFFNSLYRQGKRAEFVRYWGEGHVLESPANIRDMWNRIFAWLEQFPGKAANVDKSPGQ
jgi:dipeptidyl aminopeptidase/acylaminoacyl peptidase